MAGTDQSAPKLLWKAIVLLTSLADATVRRRLALTLAIVISGSILAALTPIALKLIVDGYAQGSWSSAPLVPVLLILAYAGAQFLTRSLGELRMLLHGSAEQRLQREISARFFEHAIHLPVHSRFARSTGALTQILANGLAGCHLVLHHAAYSGLPVLFELGAALGVILYLGHAPLVALMLLAAIAYLIAFAVGIVRAAPPARAASATRVAASALLTDALGNHEALRYATAESVMLARYTERLSDCESRWQNFLRMRTANGILVAGIFGVSIAGALLYCGDAVRAGTMTLGELVLVATYMLQMMRPLEMLGFALRDVSQGTAFLERMVAIFDEPVESAAGVECSRGPRGGEIAFEKVSFAYPGGAEVLHDVSFSVVAGSTVAVVGPSGSGKSTLARLLVRFYEPSRGRILLDGRPLGEHSPASLRRAIAVVAQDALLFDDTIANNIGLGVAAPAEHEIAHVASLARLDELLVRSPAGLASRVGERGFRVSGGERQRIAIARAILRKPRVFVFDEMTSSLDIKTEEEILEGLRDVSRGRTTLLIAHRLSTVVHAEQILVLEAGRITERGSHRELLLLDGTYARMWRAQQAGLLSHRSMAPVDSCAG